MGLEIELTKRVGNGYVAIEAVNAGRVGVSLPANCDNILCYISGLWVEEVYRRQGLGRKLINACIATAKEQGAKGVYLNVFSRNHIALRLYRSLGFKPTERERVGEYMMLMRLDFQDGESLEIKEQ